MNKEDFINTITYLTTAYNKVFNEQEIAIWYDMLKDYPEEVLNKSIKEIVSTEQFMPTIATIISKCKEYKPLDRFEVLEQMRANNYFKTADEYLKAKQWLECGTIPEWFKNDITKFYDNLADGGKYYLDKPQITTPLIGSEDYDN